MVTIKIEIGFDKERGCEKKEPDIKRAVWLAALLDSAVWIFAGITALEIFYGTVSGMYSLPYLVGILLAYLFYLILKAWFLMKKYGRRAYWDAFGHTGILLAAVSVVMMLCLI